jgi:hypothetical protein
MLICPLLWFLCCCSMFLPYLWCFIWWGFWGNFVPNFSGAFRFWMRGIFVVAVVDFPEGWGTVWLYSLQYVVLHTRTALTFSKVCKFRTPMFIDPASQSEKPVSLNHTSLCFWSMASRAPTVAYCCNHLLDLKLRPPTCDHQQRVHLELVRMPRQPDVLVLQRFLTQHCLTQVSSEVQRFP